MSHDSSPQLDSSQPTYRRLKLVMSTPDHQHAASDTAQSNVHTVKEELSRSSSPARPSYSPVTPTLSNASVHGQDTTESEWIEEPAPLPVSLEDNPDAIALQATLSLLQMQRQQSLHDIRGLQKMKQEALERPEAFVEDLKNGKLSKQISPGISFDPDMDDSEEDENPSNQEDYSQFGKLPVSQNIVRCPPIEWAKYRITGEPLDRLHELQKQHPGITEDMVARGLHPQPSEIAAPYRPFTDKINPPPPSSSDTRQYDR